MATGPNWQGSQADVFRDVISALQFMLQVPDNVQNEVHQSTSGSSRWCSEGEECVSATSCGPFCLLAKLAVDVSDN